ncbi:diguanylate cyclase [Tsukamurella strandjordii]|uniref:GGDEF domain-containing protein n=1 Tax=Tsukamurella TaxID=2060 RepID=UPI001C7D1993|nr:diguanylate cyclase [Tsukamurella sp. TY48]GIZ99501.1 hypothetical protein TTY48_41130 [Tsukamurella sp. TY48]
MKESEAGADRERDTARDGVGDGAVGLEEALAEIARLRRLVDSLSAAVDSTADMADLRRLRHVQAIADAAPDSLYVKDTEGKYLFLNAAALEVVQATDRPISEVLGHDDSGFFAPETFEQLRANDQRVITTGMPLEIHEEGLIGGQWRIYRSLKAPYRDPFGRIIGLIGVSRDVTETWRSAEALARAEARWQVAVDSSGDGIWDWDLATGAVFYSSRWKTMLGYEEDEVGDSAREWESRVHPDDLEAALMAMSSHMRGESPEYSCEHRLRTRSGEWLWVRGRGRVIERDPRGRILRMVGVSADISAEVAERRRVEREALELERLAEIDDLTGIANRRGFTRALSAAWHSAGATGRDVHLALIDVDDFKRYNDTHGHTAGDRALRQLASVVARVPMNGGDIAARYGGDELALIMVGELDFAAVLETIRAAVLELGLAHDGSRPVTVSCGGASGPAAATTPGLLLREADRRLYQAKAAGRNRVVAD